MCLAPALHRAFSLFFPECYSLAVKSPGAQASSLHSTLPPHALNWTVLLLLQTFTGSRAVTSVSVIHALSHVVIPFN